MWSAQAVRESKIVAIYPLCVEPEARNNAVGWHSKQTIQSGREISVFIVTDDYLCYKEPKSPYNFFLF